MERVEGIEPSSPAWKAGVIAFIRYPRGVDKKLISQIIFFLLDL